MNCEAYSSFKGVSFNHRIISANIHLSQHRNKKQSVKPSLYNWPSLANSDISNQYTVIVRNKFDTLQETFERHTLNDTYENFVTTQKNEITWKKHIYLIKEAKQMPMPRNLRKFIEN